MGISLTRAFACAIALGCLAGCASPQMAVGSIPNTGGVPFTSASSPDAPPLSSAMPASLAAAQPPAGFVSFCMRFQDQCLPSANPANSVQLTSLNWTILKDVNDYVNRSIAPEDDLEHYGRAEYWTIPTDGRGDCDDYAVTKRKILIAAGIPELALRIAVVLTPDGSRHAVLTVATDKGDYVLDNLRGDIRSWASAQYTWIERQSPTSAWGWVALDTHSDMTATAATGAISSPASSDAGDKRIGTQ
jgi:predicted transglutaminase-like cysteine proteinase